MRTPALVGFAIVCLVVTHSPARDEPSDADLAKKPITTNPGVAFDRLRAWWKHGSAAGHVGDWYDNRDRGHSELDLSKYPQLRKVRYSKEDIDNRRDFGLQRLVLPRVVLGNSSTAASPEAGGSHARAYYASPQGLDLLQKQYLGNNLYVYPEHKDHDPGHSGIGDGYGDLLPTNTPYLITSQGSSGSDMPFVQATAAVLASLRPEVKKKLVDSGMLMPTVQLLLRWSCGGVRSLSEYHAAKAHPTAFDPSTLDHATAMDRAHAIRLNTIPPMVKLAVVREDKPVVGRDYFEPMLAMPEQHSDTVSVVSRVWRGHARTRTLVVSAEKSVDLNGYPLTFRWEVLRGDERRVKITPKNKAGSVAEIHVEYHERRPIAPGSPLESNRVDVGVFANNGVYPSAPGFVTFFSLDSEGRSYDDAGRIVEMGYGMGFTEVKVVDAAKAMAELSRDGLAAKVLGLTAAQRGDLAAVAKLLEPLDDGERQKRLGQRREALGASPQAFVDTVLTRALKSIDLWNTHRTQFRDRLRQADQKPHRDRVSAAATKLAQLGIVSFDKTEETMTIRPALSRPGDAKNKRLSAFERAMVEEFNGHVLAEVVLPGLVAATFRENYVDPRLTTKKPWRDVYFYEGDTLMGWRRYNHGGPDRVFEFTAEGWLVLAKDTLGRPTKARTVVYGQVPLKEPSWRNPNPLVHAWGDEVITFAYEGNKRIVKSRGKLQGT